MTYHITSARLVISARLEPASSPLSVLVGTLLTDYSGLAPLPPDVHAHTRCATSAAATHVSLQRHIPVQVLLRKDSLTCCSVDESNHRDVQLDNLRRQSSRGHT